MAIQKLSIAQFLVLAQQHPVLDVRSPGEYSHAHIPGAFNLPLFSDEERKVVGTAYKQESRETAVKIGLEFFGVKMKAIVEKVEIIAQTHFRESNRQHNAKPPSGGLGIVLVHCWRGGMRSAGVAWLLDLYGFKVYTLVGGYKAYRKWVLAKFDEPYPFHIIGGYTGSGKTLLLQELVRKGQVVIDLEGLANHKGSAFGALGEKAQPKQEMFENLLAGSLQFAVDRLQFAVGSSQSFDSVGQHLPSSIQHPAYNTHPPSPCIWLEDESQRIGNLQIPMPLWHTMRRSPVFFLNIPFEERLNYLTAEYGRYEKEKLLNAIIRIQKRLGGLETKNAISYLVEDDYRECFRILLTYYDKWYYKGLFNRENISALLNKIPATTVDTYGNTHKLLTCSVTATL